jgi:hypothetical protein
MIMAKSFVNVGTNCRCITRISGWTNSSLCRNMFMALSLFVIPQSVGARSSRPMELRDSEKVRGDRAPTKTSMDAATETRIRTPTLGNMVAYFKYQTTKQINAIRQGGVEIMRQRNYHNHIIRDDKPRHFICQYVQNNPANCTADSEHHLDGETNMPGVNC